MSEMEKENKKLKEENKSLKIRLMDIYDYHRDDYIEEGCLVCGFCDVVGYFDNDEYEYFALNDKDNNGDYDERHNNRYLCPDCVKNKNMFDIMNIIGDKGSDYHLKIK